MTWSRVWVCLSCDQAVEALGVYATTPPAPSGPECEDACCWVQAYAQPADDAEEVVQAPLRIRRG